VEAGVAARAMWRLKQRQGVDAEEEASRDAYRTAARQAGIVLIFLGAVRLAPWIMRRL